MVIYFFNHDCLLLIVPAFLTFFVSHWLQVGLTGEGVRQLLHGPRESGANLFGRIRLRRDVRSPEKTSLESGAMFCSARSQIADYLSSNRKNN